MIDGLPEHTYYLFFNERKDLISLDVYHFKQFVVIASICEDVEPFRDYTGKGTSSNRKKAIQMAIKDLNKQAYRG